ncbi:MAG: ABC transporter substrate-binding protein [Betaproteobacteria bacterium]|nr:ABC transporter substrate-binding protein [Betaproteobacteria bacterium]
MGLSLPVTRLAAAALLLLLVPLVTDAQQKAGKVPRIGVLAFTQMTAALQEAFRQGLRDHGYVEERNVFVEWRAAEGRTDRAKALAVELVGLKVDILVAIFTPAVQAAKDATSTIPIVMAPAGAPVATGFVASLARPAGNITGITGLGAELQGKQIQLLRELIPGLTRVGLLINAADPFAKSFVDEAQAAAKRTGVQLHVVDVRRPQEIDAAFAAMTNQRAGAVIVQGVLTASAWQAGDLAVRHRLPSLSNLKQFAESGGLMSYGANFTDIYRRAASYVDRILKGAKPGDLPVEQPTRFEFVINIKTAKALGLTIPQSLLLRADQLIE